MRFLSIFVVLLLSVPVFSQEVNEFAQEVDDIQRRYEDGKPEKPIVFAGSSSIRFWEELETLKEGKVILNHGFGGSKMSDLLLFHKELILDFDPSVVFIYEGDNDIAQNRPVVDIVTDTKELMKLIKKSNPQLPIVLISAKPSIDRWKFKFQYEELNREFAALADKKSNISYVDVWTPMLDEEGRVRTDIFIEDDLHMNAKGYAIWNEIFLPLLD